MKDIIENLRFERETRKKNAKKITKEEIEKIIFLSNEQQMSAKEIAEELGVAETRVERIRWKLMATKKRFTARDRNVILRMKEQGKSSENIAKRLGVTPKRVNRFLESVRKKERMKNGENKQSI